MLCRKRHTCKDLGAMSLGFRLRQFITLHGFNVREFSAAVGIPYRSIHEYLSDNRKPGADHLAQMAEFGVDIEWLLLGRVKPALIFDFSKVEGLQPLTGYIAADKELATYLLSDAIRLVDEWRIENEEKRKVVPIGGLLASIWSVFQIYADAANRSSDNLENARKNRWPTERIGEMIVTLLHDAIRERLKVIDQEDASD